MNKEKTLSSNLFPVVGIGASAGGLDAFKKLLKAIPENSGMAYVLVQHLDPSHESLLPGILQKITSIPVLEITDDIKVQPDHIYIIPSNKMLLANDGVLQLSPRPEKSKKQRNLPIDLFFNSLAEVHQTHAIGVVLSGTASDGTQGLKAIKEQGGLTFAQDVGSAAYDGMPQSAMMAGVVDFILPPEKIPGKLMELVNGMYKIADALDTIPEKDDLAFKQIISLLRLRKATDFTFYKQTTIRRRILRRMVLNKHENIGEYLDVLRNNNTELDALYQDLLIPVTTFFRDPKVFDSLGHSVFSHIADTKQKDAVIRIWVAGCSTGQEAYSLAICLKEYLGEKQVKVQIFATDISEPAIAKARTGIYTKSEVEDVSPQRLQEFFTKTQGGYQVNKQVRDTCVFAVHNFLKDPPFGKIDLVSCRNVLIYMEPYLQKKALTTFHYALNPKGFLLLGKSETSSSVPGLFATTGKKDKLFTRKDAPGRFEQVTNLGTEQNSRNLTMSAKSENTQTDFQKTADEIMLRKYTPAGVVVNENMDIVHFRGSTANYLEQAPGKPSHNLLKMAKDGLPFELRNVLHKAKKENAPVVKENIPIKVNGSQHMIAIEAIPLPGIVEPHYLILFHDNTSAYKTKGRTPDVNISPKTKKDEKDLRIQQLEQELLQNREDMRAITEDQEAANEELQSANEELLSSSEELQSLNEELETSKEELQTTNEELMVLNQELVSLNEQLTTARNFSESIITTIPDPLLVLDKNFRVKTANHAFYKVFHVREEETEGVLIYDLGNNQWDLPALRKLLENILPQKTKFTDFEIKHNFPIVGERVMLLNGCEITREKEEEKLILLVMKDITDQVMAKNKTLADQDLRAKELEEKVQQRTLELNEANALLQERNQELGKINKELESFTYVSSHDLQEPLRKIQTFAARILEKEYSVLSDKGKDYFNRMQMAAGRMKQLIEDLLAFSRIKLDERKFENIDLTKIVEEVKNELKEAIEEKHATVVTTELCEANIIPFQFRQLMHNLISNALKFSNPETPPHIIIASRNIICSKENELNLKPGKEYCHITFTDNGIGFEPHFSKQIFEVFQKLHGQEKYPGTGIGLAIVKKIVDNHNGFITATSELGKGATFEIYIPV